MVETVTLRSVLALLLTAIGTNNTETVMRFMVAVGVVIVVVRRYPA
jgi:hypothetical protein